MDQSPIIFIGHWNDTMSLDIVKNAVNYEGARI